MKVLAFFLLVFSFISGGCIAQSTLSVTVDGIENPKGMIYVAIFDSSNNFPVSGKQFQGFRIKASGKSIDCVFKNIPKGRYAISVYHDENGNGKLDKNIFGAPTESYAFSRNAKGYFGPPDFTDAAILLNEGQSRKLTIDLRK